MIITLILHRNECNTDRALARFLDELRPQSLESLETCSSPKFGDRKFQALSRHRESLVELKLVISQQGTIPKLTFLEACTNLVSFSLRGLFIDPHYYDDPALANRDLHVTVACLRKFKQPRALALSTLPGVYTWMTQILSRTSIDLTSFKFKAEEGRMLTNSARCWKNSLWM